MQKQYVFLIHGMGQHKAGEWHVPVVQTFYDVLRNYRPYTGLSDDQIAEQHFNFIPLNYDSVFDEYRQRWKENAEGVRDEAIAANQDVGRIFQWLADSAAEDEGLEGFFWSHLLDPLLWYCLKEARQAVVAHVNAQIGEGLKEMYADQRTNTAHIVAHSLGTSVIHDSLIALRFWPDHEGLFDPLSHKWLSVSMLANVSRLMEARFKIDAHLPREAFKAYRSVLNPGAPGSICINFLNVHHRIDPFTWPRQFRPANWPIQAYSDIETLRLRKITEVHDVDHYLNNPRVHVPLLRVLSHRVALGSLEEQTKVWNDFIEAYPISASIELDSLRDLFSRDPEKKLNVKKLAQYLYSTYQELTA